MFEFESIWVFWLMPLPLLALLLPAVNKNSGMALRIPQLNLPSVGNDPINHSKKRRFILPVFIWLLLIASASGPQWLGEPITLPTEGRDLMLAVDLSGSMEIEDMEINGKLVNRLVMLKGVLGDFIERRVGDRLGLILFADTAFLQTPLTHDRQTVQQMLDESVLGLVGEKTAIGDALGLSAKKFDEQSETNKILILLTDGQNTAGNVTPEEALKIAVNKGITVYTIGVGADEMLVQSFFGNRRVNPSQDLDEEMLRNIAEQTGGMYFRARDTKGLEAIYKRLDELEPIAKDTLTMRPLNSLFHYPLAAAFILSLLIGLMRYLSGLSWTRSKRSTKKSAQQSTKKSAQQSTSTTQEAN
ncbi:MAG: Ca-activated chloride channel family protein [Alteromonadaceae bacterium]|jgi:Ca-activated chloride channel family protein